VHEDVGPAPRTVAAGLGLNAYRIVQEALTNAIRHGAAERAWVHLWSTAQTLQIQIDDNGRGLPDGHRNGHGLIGVAERVALHGGTSRLGASPRGGCRLMATLAYGHAQPHEPDAGEAPLAER
jgi:signal transduction histidine kinase